MNTLLSDSKKPKSGYIKEDLMKVVAFNGSPKVKGNTYYAIRMVADEAVL